MRHITLTVFIAITVVACAGKAKPNQPVSPLSVSAERLEKLKALQAQLEDTPEERAIRARAGEIRKKKELDDTRKALAQNETPEMREARKEAKKSEQKNAPPEDFDDPLPF